MPNGLYCIKIHINGKLHIPPPHQSRHPYYSRTVHDDIISDTEKGIWESPCRLAVPAVPWLLPRTQGSWGPNVNHRKRIAS